MIRVLGPKFVKECLSFVHLFLSAFLLIGWNCFFNGISSVVADSLSTDSSIHGDPPSDRRYLLKLRAITLIWAALVGSLVQGKVAYKLLIRFIHAIQI